MNKVRIGIVGSKFAATSHTQAYRRTPHAQIMAAASPGSGLPSFCREHNIPSCYRDYREMLEKAEIDLVDVCVPDFLHKEATVAARARPANRIASL